jgi:hypothetical protein
MQESNPQRKTNASRAENMLLTFSDEQIALLTDLANGTLTGVLDITDLAVVACCGNELLASIRLVADIAQRLEVLFVATADMPPYMAGALHQ